MPVCACVYIFFSPSLPTTPGAVRGPFVCTKRLSTEIVRPSGEPPLSPINLLGHAAIAPSSLARVNLVPSLPFLLFFFLPYVWPVGCEREARRQLGSVAVDRPRCVRLREMASYANTLGALLLGALLAVL